MITNIPGTVVSNYRVVSYSTRGVKSPWFYGTNHECQIYVAKHGGISSGLTIEPIYG